MSQISYRLISVELNKPILRTINMETLIKINLTQMPKKITKEYLLRNVKALEDVNHEFVINDPSNKVEKLSMTIRKVLKKPTLANFFNFDNDIPKKKSNDHSVDRYIGESRSDSNNSISCEYIIPRNSLIGYCIIDLKEIKKGVNNSFRAELISKINEQVVGYVNLKIYIWNSPTKIKNEKINDQPILFIDPGCPTVTQQQTSKQLNLH